MGFSPMDINTSAPIMGMTRKPASPAMLELTLIRSSSGTISALGAFITDTRISAEARPVDSNSPTPSTTTRPRIRVGKLATLLVKLESIHTKLSKVARLVMVMSSPVAGFCTVAPLKMAEHTTMMTQMHTNRVTGSHILLPTRSTAFKKRVIMPSFLVSA